MSLGRGSGPAGGTLTAGVPRYYVESGFQAHGRQVADVRATATGAITATIRSPWPGRQVSFAAIAAASKETFFLIGQKEASDGTVIGSRIYRFRVTGTGRIGGYSLVRGGVLGGLAVGRVAATPDGSELAVSVTPSTRARHSSEPEIIVINTRTGTQAIWRTGPDKPGTVRLGVIDLSLTQDGSELVFLTQPRCVRAPDGRRCKVGGGEEVRALRPATRGGRVTSSRLIVRQASLMRLSTGYINGVVISPGGSTLTLAVVNSPPRGSSSVSLMQVSGTAGTKLGVVYRMRTGNGFSYRFFGASPSGRFFLLDAGPTSGAINGWIDHGHLVRLRPAGDNIFFEAW
jgi:hypothetical protein